MIGKARPIVVVSDLHVGCKMGLMPRDGFRLDEGNPIMPSRFQLQLCDWWDEFWAWADKETGGTFDLVVNGDAIDGVHHEATTLWSNNLDDQRRAAVEVIRPVSKRAVRTFVIRGTETHVGKSGQHEEAIARELGAHPSETGTHSHWELYYRVGGHLIHFAHHIGTTSSPFSKSSALQREMVLSYVESGQWGDDPPALFVRSHRHYASMVGDTSQHGMTFCWVTPAWQLKTPFGHRSAYRMFQPVIGGLIIFASDNGIYGKPWSRRLPRPKEVTQ